MGFEPLTPEERVQEELEEEIGENLKTEMIGGAALVGFLAFSVSYVLGSNPEPKPQPLKPVPQQELYQRTRDAYHRSQAHTVDQGNHPQNP